MVVTENPLTRKLKIRRREDIFQEEYIEEIRKVTTQK